MEVIASWTTLWHSLAFSHLRLADKLTELSAQLESGYVRGINHAEDSALVQPYSIGGITAATAFVETNINEMFESICNDRGSITNDFSEETIAEIKKWWEFNHKKMIPAVQKYQKFLQLSNNEKFSSQDELFNDMKRLVYLRNQLTHYKPQWILAATQSEREEFALNKDIQKHLEQKIKPSKFFENTNAPYYPSKLLGYGGTHWALHTAFHFSQEFYHRIDIKPPYAHILKYCSQIEINSKG
ncbi:hypothetical protein ABEP50_15825 [Priestia megaterium]